MLLCLGSTVWTNPGFSVSVSQNHQMDRSQIETNSSVCSKSSAAASNHSTQGKNASSSQIPTVCFDLGDEWDDWGDFDDEKLVHASETSAVSCTTNHKPQVQQPVDNSKPGAVRTTFVCSACVKLCGLKMFHMFCREEIVNSLLSVIIWLYFTYRLCQHITCISLSLTSQTHCQYTAGVRTGILMHILSFLNVFNTGNQIHVKY